MHHHVMLASGKHPAISPAIDADQIGYYAERLALDYLAKLDNVAPTFDEGRKESWLAYLRTLTTSNQISVHPNGIMSGNLDMLTTTECEQVVCPHSYEGKVWTEEAWKEDRSGDNTFIDAMHSGTKVEIDADMYDYWLGVLPPVMHGPLRMQDGSTVLVDFGFAEGYERIVGFWAVQDPTNPAKARYYCQESRVINTRC